MTELVVDPELGFRRVDPTPELETLKQQYKHDYYVQDKPVYLEKTEREFAYWRTVWRLRLDLMQAALGGEAGRLLDIGASGGFFLHTAREAGWRPDGVEPSDQSVAFARDKFALELFHGFLEDFPTPAEPFDAVHMSLVLEHVRDPRETITRVMDLLRPGGVVWVETPNDFNPFQEIIHDRLEKPRWWVVPKHHLNYFDYNSLSRLLAWAGGRELDRIGSFPMEMFVLMGKDYVGDDAVGGEAHGLRMRFEENVLAGNPGLLLDYYRALAWMGLGRTCNLLAKKE